MVFCWAYNISLSSRFSVCTKSICSIISDKLELVMMLSTMPFTKSGSDNSPGLMLSIELKLAFKLAFALSLPSTPFSMQFNRFLISSMD